MYDNDLFLDMELPKKLNRKETKEYFERYQNGDSHAREDLILHNIKLVIYRVESRFSKFPFDKEEMFSAGMIGLIKSIDTFDIEKGYEFSSYAVRCIDNEILMFTKKESKHLEVDSLDKPIATKIDGKDLKIKDIILDDTVDLIRDYEKNEQIKILKNLVNNLPEEEITLLHLYFEDRLTQEKIAKKYQISRSNVSRKIKDIVKKLSEGFNEYNGIGYQNNNDKENIVCKMNPCNEKGKYLSKRLDTNGSNKND